jgi:hypothetical protein
MNINQLVRGVVSTVRVSRVMVWVHVETLKMTFRSLDRWLVGDVSAYEAFKRYVIEVNGMQAAHQPAVHEALMGLFDPATQRMMRSVQVLHMTPEQARGMVEEIFEALEASTQEFKDAYLEATWGAALAAIAEKESHTSN